MHSFKLVLAAAVALFVALPSVAQEKAARQEPKVAKQDRQALAKLAQADMAEIATGKLAAQKASSPEVRKYGEHMVQEHTKMLEDGKKLAQARGIQPPANTDKKHQAAMKKLEAASGEDFDRMYIEQMVKDHDDVLKLAQKTAKDTKDADLKAHVQKGEPHIKQHLEQARKLQASLGASTGSSGNKKQK